MNATPLIALVTGANKGIGLEICRQLAEAGHLVLLGCRDLTRGTAAAEPLQRAGLDVRPLVVDLGNPASFPALHDRLAAEHGRLDILVNNAAIATDWAYTAATVPVQQVRETFEINVFALIELTQRLLPLLRQSPAGRIVNQSSVLASLTLHSQPGSGLDDWKALAYNASKTALNAFTVHLAHALKHTPVKVNAAHPGSVATDMNPAGTLTVEVGARTAVQLATLAADGPSGGFFHLGQALPW